MVSKKEVLEIASLAHLHVEDRELDRFTKEFNTILDYVNQLQKVDVSDVAPMSHVHGISNVFREDKVRTTLTTEEALQNAPDNSGPYIRVPIIIGQGTEH